MLFGPYERVIDRESAYEILKTKAESLQPQEDERAAQKGRPPSPLAQAGDLFAAMAKSAARSIQADAAFRHRKSFPDLLDALPATGRA